MKCRRCKKGMRKAKQRVHKVHFNLFNGSASFRSIKHCPHCGMRHGGTVTVDFISACVKDTLRKRTYNFQSAMRGTFYEPSETDKYQTKLVEEYFRRCDAYDDNARMAEQNMCPRAMDTAAMQKNSRSVLEEIAYREGIITVTDLKGWICDYNKRRRLK